MRRIMIVSEEPFFRNLIGSALAGLDADVRCPEGMAGARRLCGEVLFDLIIVVTATPLACCCDAMPRRGGLRRPVVYVIAWQQSEQAVLGLLECGVDQYMTFPVNLLRLRQKVAGELFRMSV